MWLKLLKTWNTKAAGELIDVADAEADVLLKAGYAEKHTGNPLEPLLAESVGKLSKSLEDAVTAAIKKFGDAMVLSRKNGDPLIFGEGQGGDRRKTFGAWLCQVYKCGDPQRAHKDDLKALAEFYEQKDLSAGTGTAGGFLVPVEMGRELLALAAEMGIVRPRAYIQPMSAKQITIPTLDHRTAPSAGDTAYFGGMNMFWQNEAASRTLDEPSFKEIELEAYDLGGYVIASNTLVQDSGTPLEALLKRLFGGAVAWYEDYAFLRGTGNGRPLGAIASGALISVTRSAANAFALADAANMLGRLLPGADLNATAFVIHPFHLTRLIQMNASGSGSPLVWMPDGVRGRPKLTLFGYDVCISEKVPAVNVAGDAGVYDFSKYVIGDRNDTEIAYSAHAAFRTNQAAWRIVKRVDGQPWLTAPVTLADGSSTVSPFVTAAAG